MKPFLLLMVLVLVGCGKEKTPVAKIYQGGSTGLVQQKGIGLKTAERLSEFLEQN